MGPILADTSPVRARFVWLSAAFATAVIAFALSRPAPTPHVPARPIIGHCADRHAMAPAPAVHSYYVTY